MVNKATAVALLYLKEVMSWLLKHDLPKQTKYGSVQQRPD